MSASSQIKLFRDRLKFWDPKGKVKRLMQSSVTDMEEHDSKDCYSQELDRWLSTSPTVPGEQSSLVQRSGVRFEALKRAAGQTACGQMTVIPLAMVQL
ncbi:hypothetical protein RvY_18218 [Ramazzottius varieornatus]|uniref:Uncharacterized protein n=1 Tax=Ramazzottius varieornatus TaxID=947166 RepID=A0A1D1W4Y4_RAMVA|nr:hypothetical protein RvY_18218 [Ramazzottius varieornatus]